MNKKTKMGISLIILVITIIVVIILAGSILLSLSENNPIESANKSVFLNDLKSFQTELTFYETKQFTDEMGSYDPTLLQADETIMTYNDIVISDKTMLDIIPSLRGMSKYSGQFQVINGELVFGGLNSKQQNWAAEAGLDVVVIGEPKVAIISPVDTVVAIGTDIVYTIKFSSNVALTTINLDGYVEVLDDAGVTLLSQPSISYGTVSGTDLDTVRQVDIAISTNTLLNGAYKLRIKAGAVTNANDISNSLDIISLIGFDIDNTAPENPTMSASTTEWTNESVEVTVTYSTDSIIKEYSLDGTNWNSYNVPVEVNENNITVYARGKDSVGNESGVATITVTNIEKIIPTIVYGTNGATNVEIAGTTVTVSDLGGSNINVDTLQYVWDTQNLSTPSSGWVTFTNGTSITKTGVSGTYYLWVQASDNAGNNVVSKTNSFILIQPVAANKPVLSSGMTALKWNGSSWDTVSNPDTDTSWYNYSNKEWANAQTLDGSMWVWVPRYEYKITSPHTSTAQTIAINFLENTSISVTSGYTRHPGFTFGSVELEGIWVAKFEASGSVSSVGIKPNVISLRSIKIGEMFTACKNMETTYGTRYGWGTSGTGIDTHLMKNVEWGAVAYFSQSIYGKNSEVWINPNSDYLTGQAGTSVNIGGTATTYPYDNLTYGIQASTTGNVYGVYDMSGGAYEYTASYVNNGNAALSTNGSSLVSAGSQYKDVYTSSGDTQTGNYTANASKKGDAIYETSNSHTGTTSWYNDSSSMPFAYIPFFERGGYYDTARYTSTGAGLFHFAENGAYAYSNGSASTYAGFRPVLAVDATL